MKYLKYFENYDIEDVEEHDIDDILKSYLRTAIFTEEDREEFEDKNINDFSNNAESKARKEIEWFVDIAGNALDNISDESIGSDIWYTRNGHGVGFWDRGYDKDIEDFLCDLCEVLGDPDIYVSDKGEIEFGNSIKYEDFDLEKYNLKKTIKKYNL